MKNSYYLEIENLKIFFRTKNDSKNVILFIHGSSLSSEIWEKQFDNLELSKKYKLIAFDLPGHGKSSQSKSPYKQYTLKGIAAIVSKIINELKLESCIIVGLSLGTNIVADSIKSIIGGIKGLVLAGAAVGSTDIPPSSYLIQSQYIHVFAIADPTVEELTGYLNTVTENSKLRESCKLTYSLTDPKFRSVMGQSVADGEWINEISNLEESNIPICIVMGENEKIVRANYLDNTNLKKWSNEVIKIQGSGHLVNWETPNKFNEILIKFAEEVFK